MNNRQALNIERIPANMLPEVNLTSDLSEAVRKGTALIVEQCQCDCDCACAVEDQALLPTLSGPVTAYLELTGDCPNRCPGCGNVFVNRQQPVSLAPPLGLAQWEIIVDKLLPWVSLLKLTGGEPTHYPDLFSFLHLLRKRNLPFALLSNGRWPEPRRLLDEIERCPNFRGFLISLHGPNARIHESFTASHGSFLEAKVAIRAASLAGFDVTVSVVLVRPNLGLLRDTAEVALTLGANYVIYERYIGEPRLGLTLSDDELLQAIGEVQALEEEGLPVKFGNCIPQCFERSSSTGCTAGRSFCTVDPWGNVRPCNHAHVIAGNLLTESLQEVWWSESMAHWREVASPDCLSCQAYSQCHGGCRALSYSRDADPLMREPLETSVSQPQEQITLYTSAIPQSRYTVRSEPFGPTLICNGRVLPVSPSTLAFLTTIENHYTLAQIQQEYGGQMLSLIGGLYAHRFIGLHFPDSPLSVGSAE